jgi:hypothetical protein
MFPHTTDSDPEGGMVQIMREQASLSLFAVAEAAT